MAGSERRGPPWLLLLVLLLGIAGGGAYNYHRNWQAEQAAPRPFRGYGDAELQALIQAYEQEFEVLASRRPSAPPADEIPGGALLGERVEAFERARAAGEAHRQQLGERAQREAALRELTKERALRAELGAGMVLHLRRLLTL
jgi:hypothetical protein